MSDPNPFPAPESAPDAVPRLRPRPSDAERLAVLRAGLPATRAGIYLNTGTAGPLPAEAAAAMAEIADRELAVGRATRESFEELLARLDEARAVVAAVLGTGMDLVALTHSTTEGINLALGTIDWRAGDRAVTTSLEHPGVTGPLALLRDRLGVEVVEAEIGDGGDDALTMAALEDAAVGGRTRAIVASHVAWSTGALLPAAAIASAGAEARGGRHPRWRPVGGGDPAGDRRDRRRLLRGQRPEMAARAGGDGRARGRSVDRRVRAAAGGRLLRRLDATTRSGRDALWPDARRFETAGLHKPSIVGLARSAGWLSMFVGLPWAHERAARLAGIAADRLAATPGVTLVTPRARMATLVSFRVAGWTADEVAEALGRRVHAIVRSIPGLDAVRLCVAFFTTDDELRRVLDAVEELAAHTPATLPARPAIEFLDQAPE